MIKKSTIKNLVITIVTKSLYKLFLILIICNAAYGQSITVSGAGASCTYQGNTIDRTYNANGQFSGKTFYVGQGAIISITYNNILAPNMWAIIGGSGASSELFYTNSNDVGVDAPCTGWVSADANCSEPILLTGTGCTVVPIELSSFKATATEESIHLHWRTETEINNAYMAIERSLDGEHFQEIVQIKGAGTTVEPQHYQFTDAAPKAGINYYRLRQVDTDGTTVYHKTLAVSFNTKDIILTAVPTLTSDILNIYLSADAEESTTLSIIDINGKVVREQQFVDGFRQMELNVSDLAAGQYFVRVRQAGAVQTARFVKE